MLAMKPYRFPSSGFTLIELMVTITIAAVLMMVAVPSLLSYQRNSELTSLTNSFIGAMNAARGEAMKRNMNAFVVPLNGSSWNSGWVVFVDIDRSLNYSQAADFTVAQSTGALPAHITMTGTGVAAGSTPYVMFNGSGYSRAQDASLSAVTLTLARGDVAGADALKQTRRIRIANTGRVSSCTPKTATDTDCPSS
jgi:type IV fimbrial biogenesis protein FimT